MANSDIDDLHLMYNDYIKKGVSVFVLCIDKYVRDNLFFNIAQTYRHTEITNLKTKIVYEKACFKFHVPKHVQDLYTLRDCIIHTTSNGLNSLSMAEYHRHVEAIDVINKQFSLEDS